MIFTELSCTDSGQMSHPSSIKRINYRPVDRVYFKKQELGIVILLAASQAKDIYSALDLARTWQEGIMASPSTRS